jgi:nitrogen-specific signal transduction histidine kinase/CheY-like chemotaxis protein
MIFGMVHDISLRKKSEAKLIQAQKMDSIGALAGGIAHDFKNVLSGISGFTSLLMRNESNPQRLEYCQRILNAIQRSAEMTNKLLSFGRQEQASTQPLDVNALIVDVLKLIEPTVPATIKTLLKLEEDLPALLGDPTHFRQILLNLCVNALEAMPLGGTLTIASRMADTPPQILLTAPTTATDMMLAIIISDSGHGMDETVRGKIFEPFFTTKHGEHKGTGLGLATTYTLVNKMSGHIDLQSAVGLGTTFTLYFPIVDRRDARGRRSDKEGSATRPTVLVVDDEPAIVDFLSEILNLEGFRVRTCHDGSGALTLLDKFHDAIDCLVIDQNMPTTTGIQTIEQLRAKGLRLPCILLSGLREQQLPLSEHVEVNHILEKPFDPMKLVFLIRSLLSEP